VQERQHLQSLWAIFRLASGAGRADIFPVRPVAIVFALALGACGGGAGAKAPTLDEIHLIGELSLHELFPPDWTHAWAAFLDPSGRMPLQNAESVFAVVPEPTPAVGQCEVIGAATCDIACPEDTVCQWNRCGATKPPKLVDAGAIRITRGHGPLAPMSLAYDADGGFYLSTPNPGPGFLFTGGEIVAISFDGGGPLPAIQAQFESPAWLDVTAPDSNALRLPTSGPLHVAWSAVHRTALELTLNASSTANGDTRIIRCTVEDNGAFDVGPEMLAQLPPPPRRLHFELSRLTRQPAPAGPHQAVLIHGGFTVVVNSDE
jgi:hypothetical protein